MINKFIDHLSNIDNFQISVAQDTDLPRILEIWKEGLLQIYPDIEISDKAIETFVNNFKDRTFPFNFWVAKTNHILGWCSILPAFSHPLKQTSNGEVSTYVDKGIIEKGVGTTLMKFVFSELENKGIDSVFGFANPQNTKSIKMCENAGMRVCGETSKRIILIKEY